MDIRRTLVDDAGYDNDEAKVDMASTPLGLRGHSDGYPLYPSTQLVHCRLQQTHDSLGLQNSP